MGRGVPLAPSCEAMTTASPLREGIDAGEGGMSRHAYRPRGDGLPPAGRTELRPRQLGAAGGAPAARYIGGGGCATTGKHSRSPRSQPEQSPLAARRRHRARGARPAWRLILAVVLVIAIPALVLLEVSLLQTLTALSH